MKVDHAFKKDNIIIKTPVTFCFKTCSVSRHHHHLVSSYEYLNQPTLSTPDNIFNFYFHNFFVIYTKFVILSSLEYFINARFSILLYNLIKYIFISMAKKNEYK